MFWIRRIWRNWLMTSVPLALVGDQSISTQAHTTSSWCVIKKEIAQVFWIRKWLHIWMDLKNESNHPKRWKHFSKLSSAQRIRTIMLSICWIMKTNCYPLSKSIVVKQKKHGILISTKALMVERLMTRIWLSLLGSQSNRYGLRSMTSNWKMFIAKLFGPHTVMGLKRFQTIFCSIIKTNRKTFTNACALISN